MRARARACVCVCVCVCKCNLTNRNDRNYSVFVYLTLRMFISPLDSISRQQEAGVFSVVPTIVVASPAVV